MAGIAWPGTTARSCSSVTRCPASGSRRSSPSSAGPSCAPTRWRCCRHLSTGSKPRAATRARIAAGGATSSTPPRPPDVGVVEAVASSGGDLTVYTRRSRQDSRIRVVFGPAVVRELALGREWSVAADGFWQVHRAAPEVLAAAVVELLEPRPGERVWDLYGGVGLFAGALAPLAGPVTVVEADARAAAAARRNLADLPRVRVVRADVAAALANPRWRRIDLVVLDPPRAGVGAAVVRSILDRHPRAVAYVSCDPASLARDVATFIGAGWRLAALRAFDAFPMTHHVECVALLTPEPSG